MTTWEQVAACWKESDDPDDFDVAVLEEVLPGGKDDASKERRQAIWKAMDNNGNRFVSLAEYDGWFNQHTMAYEGSKGFKPDAGKASRSEVRVGKCCSITARASRPKPSS